jgi:Helix-turn-helix domain
VTHLESKETTVSTSVRENSPRQRRPYVERFRRLDSQQQAEELATLKRLYEDDGLSIRQIAERMESSYGFMHARLTEAGVNLAVNSTSYIAPAQQDQG